MSLDGLDEIGQRYDEHRRSVMVASKQGLTKTYNRFHDHREDDADILRLRELHVELDRAVALAYGWSDLALDHNFHETKQGVRFTVSPTARQEIVDRLLELNHQRHGEEVAAGLHEKHAARRTGSPTAKRVGKRSGHKRQAEGTLF
jgi:hypothetical protein